MTPHKCPICGGYGQTQWDPDNPFGNGTSAGPWRCRPCGATGILWAASASTGEVPPSGGWVGTGSGLTVGEGVAWGPK